MRFVGREQCFCTECYFSNLDAFLWAGTIFFYILIPTARMYPDLENVFLIPTARMYPDLEIWPPPTPADG